MGQDNFEPSLNVPHLVTVLEQAIKDHPEEAILKFFRFGHLKEPLQGHSAQFAMLALYILDKVPRSAERTVAFRKLLEGKDACVRAVL